MNSLTLNAAFFFQDIAVRPYIFFALKKLEATNDSYAALLAESIRDAFYRTLGEPELQQVERVEQIRSQLNASNEELEITDYGASANSSNGRVVRRRVGEVALSSSKPKRWALLLFHLIRRFKPNQCLEFGTCFGISTLYQSAGLALNGSGNIVTMEGAQSLASLARENFQELGCKNILSVAGKFDDVLNEVIDRHQPFDFVFVDGHHEGSATIRYFERLLPSVTRNAVIVFDDIHWSGSMKEAWKYIVRHQRVKYSVDLYQVGIIIVS